MNVTRHLAAVLALCFTTAVALAQPLVFEQVSVLDVTDGTLQKNVSVLVEGNRITAIGANIEVPANAQVAAIGGYVIPGLGEMHAHIPPMSSTHVYRYLTLYLSQGITVIRGMLGEPGHLALRSQAAKGAIFAPRIVTTGPSFNGRSVASPAQARSMVREQAESGYDMLKIHPGLSVDELEAIAAASEEHNIPFVGHVTYAVGLEKSLELGQKTIDHMDDFMRPLVPPYHKAALASPLFFGINQAPLADPSGASQIIDWFKKTNAWVVPTEALMVNYAGPASPESLQSLPGIEYIPDGVRSLWLKAKQSFFSDPRYDAAAVDTFLKLRKRLIKRLSDEGVGILLGSDAPQVYNVPGFSIHQELAIYVEAGLAPWQAIATGTRNVAQYLGDDNRGTVEAGKIADLVLLGSDPTRSIDATRDIKGVMIDGRWHSRDDLDKRLGELQ